MALFRNPPLWMVLLPLALLVIVIAGFAFQSASEIDARQEILADLNRLTKPFQVTLNGRTVTDEDELVSLLNKITHIDAHHSHPLEILPK